MKKSILSLGKVLDKSEQREINGGKVINCYSNPLCPPYNEVACVVIANKFCHYLG
ncbi:MULTISPECIES: hypothetical protein [unclassified Tenacibaculum]|uniref:hypothetical protein n=1 Tax=unclassified Tenacibaculum TaxID=2635139 RepID=UPI001F3F1793|nr:MULTISPECIES: hypothetical protein [unclassified Tenacibaculum]MCF2875513.1 hypothetical protein [Tenacibaculum sp. Cn5-1]MCF2935589.1 hypothetical protein [Tenacibaculum sp. Cn5-34]MCG7512149.1 hypothetical protein [Tenacibaculum sp. Cn5-46]